MLERRQTGLEAIDIDDLQLNLQNAAEHLRLSRGKLSRPDKRLGYPHREPDGGAAEGFGLAFEH